MARSENTAATSQPRLARAALRAQLWVTLTAIVCTVAATGLSLAALAGIGRAPATSAGFIVELGVFTALFLALVYGGLIYQVTRAGYFWRLIKRGATADARLRGPARPLTVLIPS